MAQGKKMNICIFQPVSKISPLIAVIISDTLSTFNLRQQFGTDFKLGSLDDVIDVNTMINFPATVIFSTELFVSVGGAA